MQEEWNQYILGQRNQAGVVQNTYLNFELEKIRSCLNFSHSRGYNARLRLRKEEQSAFASDNERSERPNEDDNPVQERLGFPLMRLPLEIRLMIYKDHFNQVGEPLDPEFVCRAGPLCRFLRVNQGVPVRKLLFVSKSVYQETMPLYFRTKNFKFRSPRSLANFLDIIGKYQRQHVTTITFRVSEIFLKQASKKLFECPSLENLTLGIPDCYFKNSSIALMDTPGLKHVLEIRDLKFLEIRVLRIAGQALLWNPNIDYVTPLQFLKEPYDAAAIKARKAHGIVKATDVRTVFVEKDSREDRQQRRGTYKKIMET